MSHPHRPTMQPRVGMLHGPSEGSDAWVMNSDSVNPLAAGRFEDVMPIPWVFAPTLRCHLARHECPCIKDRTIPSCAQTVSRGGYAQPAGITIATDATLSAAATAGRPPQNSMGTGDHNPAVKSERRARQARFPAQFRGSRRVPYKP